MPRTLDKSDVAKKTATETITTKTVAVPARKPAPFVRWIAWILGFGLVVAAAGIIAYVLDDAATHPTAPALSDIDPHESPEAFRDLFIISTPAAGVGELPTSLDVQAELADAAIRAGVPDYQDIFASPATPIASPEAVRDLHITGTRPPITSPEAVRDLHITGP